MNYTALYRKWRPSTFQEVRGQDAIVTTLKNQLKNNRVGHAYLFCGTRGTGKTTVAKILARAVNCQQPVDGSPCNACPSCQAILSGASMNVVEIDAASNNGVDNIREIRDEVRYSPTEGKYRVYIIDEVHMLSLGAFNALLKTLEEPPAYVIFILATTEVHKIPVTVLSRCQRYDFKRITATTIANQLENLTKEEGISCEPEALQYIARVSDGAMRDALSLLEQCVAFYYGQTLTYEKVLEVLGAVDTEVFHMLTGYLVKKDVTGALGLVEELNKMGRELGQFSSDFTWHLRNLLMAQTAGGDAQGLDVSREEQNRLQLTAREISLDQVMRYIRIFSELSASIKYAKDKRVLLEVALIKAMRPSMEADVESLKERVEALERRGPAGTFFEEDSRKVLPQEPEKEVVVSLTPGTYADLEELKVHWGQIVGNLGGFVRGLLTDAWISFDEKKQLFVVNVKDDFSYSLLLKEDKNLQELEKRTEEVLGKSIHMEFGWKAQKEKVRYIHKEKNESDGSTQYKVDGVDFPINVE